VRAARSEAGASTVEAVMVVPAAMVVLLFAVQACIWAHAAALVESAAAQANQVADVSQGQVQPGIDKARAVLAATANEVVVAPIVESHVLPDDRVEVHVQGFAESLLPWVRLPVSADRVGAIQEFRPNE
jgi:Flp pilus assembly protein TadG